MYGQGNYASQFRHGPPTQPPSFQQGATPPPAPPPPYQQGLPPPPSQPTVLQQFPSATPSHLVQSGPPHAYQHLTPAPHLPVQAGGPPPQSIQVQPPLVVNMGQSYLQPPSIHGSSHMVPSYTTAQQHGQYPSPLPPPSGLPNASTNTIQPILPPRVLPPPPQGHMLYRAQFHPLPPPPPPPAIGGLQHSQPLPPPPPSSFVPATPTSFVHTPVQDVHPPSLPPPPLPPPPSSPPPLPPSPPPLASPPNILAVSSPTGVPLDALSTMHTDKLSLPTEADIGSVEKVVDPTCNTDDLTVIDDQENGDVETTCVTVPSGQDEGLYELQTFLALPFPPKPSDIEITQKIEVLCQFIAKNGPAFEQMACKKEIGNPKFAFLFGGEPGSEPAIAHEYFQWMKKKCHIESKLPNGSEQSNQETRPSELQSLSHKNSSVNEGPSHSSQDSDMDMEDDINQLDIDHRVGNSVEGLKAPVSIDSISTEVPIATEKLYEHPHITEHPIAGDTEEEREHYQPPIERPDAKYYSTSKSSDGAAECIVRESVQKMARPLTVDLRQARVSTAEASIKYGSPFRLLQDYASDDSAEDEPLFEDVSPLRVSPIVVPEPANRNLHEDVRTNLGKGVDSENDSLTKEGSTFLTELGTENITSIMPSKKPDVYPESSEVLVKTVQVSNSLDTKADELQKDNNKNGDETSNPCTHKDDFDGGVDIDPRSRKFRKGGEKLAPTAQKVDEFGRLIKESASDSESDGVHYSGRRGRRGRARSKSRSRSRSPLDRRRRKSRSPRRRKDKRNRSRSRSWSPKRQRSRSKSPPPFRRTGENGRDKMRHDRGQIPDCFDFLRGRCFRGASCRFVHRGSANSDGSRHYRSRQHQHSEAQRDSKGTVSHRDSHFEEETHEDNTVSVTEHDTSLMEEVKSHDVASRDLPVTSIYERKEEDLAEKREVVSTIDNVQPVIFSEVGQPATIIGEIDQADSRWENSGEQVSQISQMEEDFSHHLQENEVSRLPEPSAQPSFSDGFHLQLTDDGKTKNLSAEILPGKPSLGENMDQPMFPPETDVSIAQQSQANICVPPDQPMPQPLPDHTSPTSTDQIICESDQNVIASAQLYPVATSMSQTGLHPVSASHPYPLENVASQTLAPKEFQPSNFSAGNFQFQPSQLPPPPPLPQDFNASLVSQPPPKDHNLPPAVVNVSASVENLPPHQAPFQDPQSQSPALANPSWTSLPPPSSYVNDLSSSSVFQTPAFHPLQSQQSPMPPRNDFPQPVPRPYPHNMPTQSQAEFHSQSFPTTGEPHRHFHMENFRPQALPMDNTRGQPFGGLNFSRDEGFARSAVAEGNQFLPGPPQNTNLHPHAQLRDEHHIPLQPPNQRFISHFQGFTASNSLAQESFPRENYGVHPTQSHTYMQQQHQQQQQQQQSSFGLQQSQMGAPRMVDPFMSRHPSSLPDNNMSHSSVGGVSNLSNSSHYNPYASTFDQTPGISKFNSSFRQETDTNYRSKYDSSGSNAATGEQAITGFGSSQMDLLPDSSRSDHVLPRLGVSLQTQPGEPSAEGFPGTKSQYLQGLTAGDQYDPLFDSMESSSKTFRKLGNNEEQEPNNNAINKSGTAKLGDDSISMLRHSSLHRVALGKDHNDKKEGAAAASISSENDEFGETAIDAEVGAVENGSPEPGGGGNWSPDNPVDLGATGSGDIEIDQVQTQGKGKKGKDSRSMKLFKGALADFVKEVLKPSWRQGNMSKEAFKTIVKKTVDKVSGAMKKHQMPKSQARINQYVESQQRKLTKLVMGYVDKYVKA